MLKYLFESLCSIHSHEQRKAFVRHIKRIVSGHIENSKDAYILSPPLQTSSYLFACKDCTSMKLITNLTV